MISREYEVNFKKTEEKANQFNLKCLLFTMFFPVIILILNVLNIFIVEDTLMNYSMYSSFAIGLISVIISRGLGVNHHLTKYIIILSIIMITTIIGMTLTYHATLLIFLPVLYASQYSKKRIIVIAYIFTVFSIFMSVMCGYYMGICDANMVLLTTQPMSNYIDAQGNFVAGQVNPNPWITLPLYYIFPRAMLLLATLPIITHISTGIANRVVKENYLRRRSEYDDMTQMYNKNRFIQMKRNYFPHIPSLAVIFFDVNNLKMINDEKGHECGDELIYQIGCSIKDTITNTEKEHPYRVGGDEFVVVLETDNEYMVLNFISRWRENLGYHSISCSMNLSAAVGYAMGAGNEIEELIHQADQNMYLDKQKHKKSSS